MELEVLYGFVSVFDGRLDRPFNDWDKDRVSQGFSWRPGSVSFAAVEAAGPLSIKVTRSAAGLRDPEASLRTIRVPFFVPEHGEVEVSTVGGSVVLQLPSGEKALTFQHGVSSSGGMWAVFSFEPVEAAIEPRVIQADSSMNVPSPLLMTAWSA